MTPALWAKVHGASTHFPIAMIGAAAACDLAALLLWNRTASENLRVAGFLALAVAASGGALAVISGLIMTRGELLGTGALRAHHRAVWPAFVLLIAATTWRALTRGDVSRRVFSCYVATIWLLTGAIALAGYTGGELLQGFP